MSLKYRICKAVRLAYRNMVAEALSIAHQFGGIDGEDHKMWVIDQMVRALTRCPHLTVKSVDSSGVSYDCVKRGESDTYLDWVAMRKAGKNGLNTYTWEEGTPP